MTVGVGEDASPFLTAQSMGDCADGWSGRGVVQMTGVARLSGFVDASEQLVLIGR